VAGVCSYYCTNAGAVLLCIPAAGARCYCGIGSPLLLSMPRIGRYGSIVILVLMVSHCSTANKPGILTGVTYSDTHIHQYTWYTSLHFYRTDGSTNQGKLFETRRRCGPSYLLTTSTIIDGDRVEPIRLCRRHCCSRCPTLLSHKSCYSCFLFNSCSENRSINIVRIHGLACRLWATHRCTVTLLDVLEHA